MYVERRLSVVRICRFSHQIMRGHSQPILGLHGQKSRAPNVGGSRPNLDCGNQTRSWICSISFSFARIPWFDSLCRACPLLIDSYPEFFCLISFTRPSPLGANLRAGFFF
jgi:hypothetical protein